jgi:hypothetical protein
LTALVCAPNEPFYRTSARQAVSAACILNRRASGVSRIGRQVAQRSGIVFQVEQLRVVELRPLDVLPVAADDGLRRGDSIPAGDACAAKKPTESAKGLSFGPDCRTASESRAFFSVT